MSSHRQRSVLLVFRGGFAALAEGFAETGVAVVNARKPMADPDPVPELCVADIHALAESPYLAWRMHRRLRALGVPLIALDRDAPWHKGLRGTRGWLVTRLRPYDGYAAHSTQSRRMFRGPSRYLPNAAWTSRYNLAGHSLAQMRASDFHTVDVAFIGNLNDSRYPEHRLRVARLQRLRAAMEGAGLSCRFLDSQGMTSAQQVELIQRSRVNLQLGAAADDSGETSWGLPERCYGIPACGGFLLSDHRRHAADDFDLHTEWVEFADEGQCLALALRYARDPEANRRIAEAAHHKVMARHTYTHRALELVEFGSTLRACGASAAGGRSASLDRILVIRRDNIGDLICTTPLIATLRRHFPNARIDAFVSDYTSAAVIDNPDLDNVYAYTKRKHGRQGPLAAAWNSAQRLLGLRGAKYDIAICAGGGPQPRVLKMTRIIAPRETIGYVEDMRRVPRGLTCPLPRPHDLLHEVLATHRLLAALGIDDEPGPLKLQVPALARQPEAVRALHSTRSSARLRVGVQLSARRLRQRWPIACFAALIERLIGEINLDVAVFWSPGAADNPTHPGDDALALSLEQSVSSPRMTMVRTRELGELIGAMDACDIVVTPDGGAMHIAAGLGKPVVALFGDSPVERWRPWGVPHVVVQPGSHDLRELDVASVFDALALLVAQRDDPAGALRRSGGS